MIFDRHEMRQHFKRTNRHRIMNRVSKQRTKKKLSHKITKKRIDIIAATFEISLRGTIGTKKAGQGPKMRDTPPESKTHHFC